jgi:catechol 2,3-dioxygenase-like lactoylglutathione lyase family enzyme
MPFKVVGIDHVQIAVPKVQEVACVAFYRDVLGFSEIPRPAELRGRGGAWFQLGPIQLHIGVDPEPFPRSKRHVCLLVNDLAAAKAQIAAGGILVEEESVADGLARFFIRDPAGNRIEIGQRV